MADEKIISKHDSSKFKIAQDYKSGKVNALKKSTSKTNTEKASVNKISRDKEVNLEQRSLKASTSTKHNSKLNSNNKSTLKPNVKPTSQTPQIRTYDRASSRVTSTPYFPKKYIEKNTPLANNVKLKKSSEIKEKSTGRPSRTIQYTNENIALTKIRSRSRTLKPDEIKLVKGPITNQIAKHIQAQKIDVNDLVINDTGKEENKYEVSNTDSQNSTKRINTSDSDDYEEDFETYESDFEEYSSDITSSSQESTEESSSDDITTDDTTENNSTKDSTEDIISEKINKSSSSLLSQQKKTITCNQEEEKMLDSGNYDLRESKHLQMLRNVGNAIQQENTYFINQREQIETSLSDEGFEDSSLKVSSFINFKNAHRKQQQLKLFEKYVQRGKDLKRMITLDSMHINLLELLPVPYDLFMKNYGKKGTFQVSIQTNEDDLSEQTQTDNIETCSKWTQFPVKFSNNHKINKDINYLLSYKNEHLGVGSDKVDVSNIDELKKCSKYDLTKLNKFLKSASRVVLTLMEEANQSLRSEVNKKTDENIFSSNKITLNTKNVPFTSNKPVYLIHTHSKQKKMLLTVHESNTHCTNILNPETEIICNSIICIWNVFKPLTPWKVLIASEKVNSCCFDNDKSNLVFAGLANGFICLWDFREDRQYHKTIIDNTGTPWVLRLPSYVTIPGKTQNIHKNEVISIKCIPNSETKSYLNFEALPSLQLCSLDSTGIIILWSVIQSNIHSHNVIQYPGQAFWGKIRLIPTQTINLNILFPDLQDSLCCYDMQFDSHDSNHIYIVTNSCHVVHCLITGSKVTPIQFKSNIGNSSWVSCIEPLPFKMPLFLVGCQDGSIRLHSGQADKCLRTFYGINDLISSSELKAIQWSKTRPCIFYSMDENRIQIWNLSISDIHPICTVPYEDKISAMCLLPHNNKQSNLVIATVNGDVKIYYMKPDFGVKSENEILKELKMLMLYVSRL